MRIHRGLTSKLTQTCSTNTHIPSPFWAAVVPVTVSLSSCNRAADLLIDWFGPEGLATVVGGERWWQVRGLDGIYAEWITERKFLNGENGMIDKGVSGRHSEELLPQMEQLESVMVSISMSPWKYYIKLCGLT